MFIYDPILDKCERYIVDKNELNLNIHAIHSNEQYLWIGTYAKGLYKVNHKTKKVEHIPFLKKMMLPIKVYILYTKIPMEQFG